MKSTDVMSPEMMHAMQEAERTPEEKQYAEIHAAFVTVHPDKKNLGTRWFTMSESTVERWKKTGTPVEAADYLVIARLTNPVEPTKTIYFTAT